jgi:hypothetical protein
MRRKSVLAALFLFTGALTALNAKADVVLGGNFGPGYSFSTGTGNSWATGDGSNSGNAVSFVAPTGSNYQLNNITFAENWYTGSDLLNVGLYQGIDPDSATLIDSFSVSSVGLVQGTAYLLDYSSFTEPLLIGGDTYWLEQTVSACGTQASCGTTWGWQTNDLSPQQTGYDAEFAGGAWFATTGATPVFQVTGTPVPAATPEPGTFLLSSLPMALFLLKRRGR